MIRLYLSATFERPNLHLNTPWWKRWAHRTPPSGETANYTHLYIKDAALGAIWGSVALIWRMLIITYFISNISDHLVLCGQQLYESSFFEICFVLWASDDIFFHFRLQCIIILHYKCFFFPPQNFNIRFSKSEIMSQSLHISSYKKNHKDSTRAKSGWVPPLCAVISF